MNPPTKYLPGSAIAAIPLVLISVALGLLGWLGLIAIITIPLSYGLLDPAEKTIRKNPTAYRGAKDLKTLFRILWVAIIAITLFFVLRLTGHGW